jgi:hypothetical protein
LEGKYLTKTGNMHLLLGLGAPEPKPIPTVKEQRSKKSNFHFTKTIKALLGIVLIVVVLGSIFAFYHPQPAGNTPSDTTPISSTNPTADPTSNSTQPPQTITTTAATKPPHETPPKDTSYMIVTNCNGHLTSTEWTKIAKYAWRYFELNTDTATGLPSSTNNYDKFTDWDIGVYLQAVMDSQKIGVIGTDGDGGSYSRINKVLVFLETRPLNTATGYPYWSYGTDGKQSDENTDATVDIADTGRLFIALNNIKTYNSTLYSTRIDNFVYNVYGNRSNYAALVPSIKAEGLTSKNTYTYYVFSGFASFWPTELSSIPNTILDNILSSGSITYGNVTLPKGRLLTEPTFYALFELQNPSSKLYTIAEKEYEAHETYYNLTNGYRAFSEGPSSESAWVYEWVVDYNKTWVVKVDDVESSMSPMVYTKTAFSFLAVYNQPYSVALASYLEKNLNTPENVGYYSAITESGSTLDTSSLHTNGMIITAARYAIQHL